MQQADEARRASTKAAAWIREQRKARGWSQAKLGDQLRVSQVQVSLWETGKQVPSPSTFAKLTALLGPFTPGTREQSPAEPSGTARPRTQAAAIGRERLAVGSFVWVEGTRDGVAKLVELRDHDATIEYFDSVAQRVTRTVPRGSLRAKRISGQTRCYWIEDGRWCIGRVVEPVEGGYLVVSHQTHSMVPERDLHVRWAQPLLDPMEVLASRANESPLFHRSRMGFVSTVLQQRAASRGLSAVLSARTELHGHQVETARRVLEDPIPRYLLADEVGLGKTIEAGFVIRQLLLDTPDARVLILVPPFLVRQWQDELRSKLHIEDFGEACRVEPYDQANDASERYDLLVVDEAHHVAACARASSAAQRDCYTSVARLASNTPRLLLLSATPLLHNEATFLAMLHLIDATSYPVDAVDVFRSQVAARADVGRVLLGLTEDAPSFLLSQPIQELRRLFPGDGRLSLLLDDIESAADAPDAARAARVRAVRVHLSETHRIYRRLLRTRRSDELSETFPVRGRSGVTLECANDEERIAADEWIDEWREAVLSDAATETVDVVRRNREDALARVFDVLLPRCCSAVRSLVAAVRFRDSGGLISEPEADLSSSDQAALRDAPVCAHEARLLRRLIQRFDEVDRDARTERIAELLDDRDDCKVVVFASFLHVALEVLARLEGRFGRPIIARHTADMTPGEVDAEVARFRDDAQCRVLVCDPSGEEGRNLQFADIIVHYDLPWSPNRLEQRLGRLDRYGEGGTVECVVFSDSSDNRTYHDRWCRSLSDDFEIFARSAAAFQFAIDALMPDVRNSLFLESAGAFSVLGGKIRNAIAAESQAIAEQDVLDSIEAVDRDTTFFDRLEEIDAQHAALREGFDLWAGTGAVDQASLQLASIGGANDRKVEYRPVLPGQRHQTLVPADWLLRWFPIGASVHGTFSRNTAIRDQDLRLMRIGNPFYDQVRAFSEWDDRGRAFALWRFRHALAGRDPDWAFRVDYVVEADPEPARSLLPGASREDPAALATLQRRLDGHFPPFLRSFWVDASGKMVTAEDVLSLLNEPYDKRAGDFNLRPERFEHAETLIRAGDWTALCKRMRRCSENVLRSTQEFSRAVSECATRAERFLGGRIEILRARAERAHVRGAELTEAAREALVADALVAGIRAPRVRLEAVGFICLAGAPLWDGALDDA